MAEREKSPDDIPEEMVAKAMQAIRPTQREDVVRRTIAAVWNDIYIPGYEHGWLDCEDDKVDKILEVEAGYSPRLTIWADGADADTAEKLFDGILDAADELAPDGVDIGAIGTMNPATHKVIKKGS